MSDENIIQAIDCMHTTNVSAYYNRGCKGTRKGKEKKRLKTFSLVGIRNTQPCLWLRLEATKPWAMGYGAIGHRLGSR